MTSRRGRRAGNPDTREDILVAARVAFAGRGYRQATVRVIAAEAGVDPALVHHYFGTKENLFAAAVKLPLGPSDAVEEIFAGGVDEVPGRLTRFFFRMWEASETREALLGQLRMALAEERPPPIRDFVVAALFDRMAQRLHGPDLRLRLSLVAANLLGVAMLRYLVRMEPLASTEIDQVIAELTPRVASYLLAADPAS